jgi:hypothetical protein
MSEENCGHISIAEYEAFDECRDCLRRWPKKDAPVSDDTDKAAREYAARAVDGEEPGYIAKRLANVIGAAFKAGAYHALSRPLIFAEEQAMAQAICDHLKLKTAIGISELNMARAAYSALQRMRTRG